MHNRRCVFRDEPNPNDPVFFEAVMGVIHELGRQGLIFELMSDEESEPIRLHQITWQYAEDPQTEISLVHDLHNGVCYLTVQSKLGWLPRQVVSAFEAAIACYAIADLISACEQRFFEPYLLIALGLLARKPDPDIIRVLSKALDHSLTAVRYCASRAVAYTKWGAFVPDLEMLLKLEPDAGVREMAEHALSVCSRSFR
ncbi:MAG: HEAT repeat domain-containing protein [Proteobacteria bacterium]|nr:HEAT repeat domain-containing protein [Pseudomonadota bacterium]